MERVLKIRHANVTLMLLLLHINTILCPSSMFRLEEYFHFTFNIHRVFWHNVCEAAHHVSIVHAKGTRRTITGIFECQVTRPYWHPQPITLAALVPHNNVQCTVLHGYMEFWCITELENFKMWRLLLQRSNIQHLSYARFCYPTGGLHISKEYKNC